MSLHFLLTNDDGVEAPGLRALAEVMCEFGEVTVVAPHREHSGCSHQVTVDRPLRLTELRPNWFELDCTPADCVRVALAHLQLPVDWIVAGINAGGNLGADVFMSGTVAAPREGALWGKPGLAVSQYRRSRDPVDWSRAAGWTRRVVPELLHRDDSSTPGVFWNVNLPDPAEDAAQPAIIHCPLDPHPLAVRYEAGTTGLTYRGRYQDRRRAPGADVERCFGGAITVSRLSIGG